MRQSQSTRRALRSQGNPPNHYPFANGRHSRSIIPPLTEIDFCNRRAFRIENEWIRATFLAEGGHIAELREQTTGINPLWIPPWPSIEPSAFSPSDTTWGRNSESKLLCGIMGHNLCLDMFGPPSADEEGAGMVAHGEAGIVKWDFECESPDLIARCRLPAAHLAFGRLL